MKLSLVVLTAGKWEGKVIPITLSQFLIGRDPQCHLRPASPVISKRHCALLVREDKVFLKDFDSTNGTFLNDRQIKGEVELRNGDELKVGAITFTVKLEASTPVDKVTPAPPTKTPVPATKAPAAAAAPAAATAPAAAGAPASAAPPPAKTSAKSGNDEDDVAAMLLGIGDEEGGSNEVPQGSTVFDLPAPGTQEGQPPAEGDKAAKEKTPPKPPGNTSTAAAAILQKYMKRPRA
jgi:pSer/pThr/pTyr-binding forkhead associated (FHA) protein